MAFSMARPDTSRSQLGAARRNRELKVRHHLEAPRRSKSASPTRSTHNLYAKDAETNLLNFVDFLSEEDVTVMPELPLMEAELIGQGSTMEVFSVAWKPNEPRVAVKRMRRDLMPKRNTSIPLEKDATFAKAVRLFYNDVKSIMQEILVMSREPLSTHRNIVRLLAVSWDSEEEYFKNRLFPPLMVVELAQQYTPTLAAYYGNNRADLQNTGLAFIADVSDGISALHMCGVIHGDLKPENILLFADLEKEDLLIAKLCDFGFANVTFLKEPVRGRSEYWAAPERIDSCPQRIKAKTCELELAGSASDVYSFGLVASFIALDGIHPLPYTNEEFQASTLHSERKTPVQSTLNELKFSDRARYAVADKIRAYYSTLDKLSSDHYLDLCQTYISLAHDTLQNDQGKRITSLSTIRKRVTGRDQFADQRKLDKFRVRPFNNSFKTFSTLQNIFSKAKNPFSKKVLDSLPPRVKMELLNIVGKTPELGEAQLHYVRRLRLEALEKDPRKDEKQRTDQMDEKIDMRGLSRILSSVRDWIDLAATLGQQFSTLAHAELDFLNLESHLRPPLFTLVDGNSIDEATKFLRLNESSAGESLPETGWTVLHLAACEGHTKLVEVLLVEIGMDPNLRCNLSGGCTPLHQAVIGKKVETVKLLLNLGGHIEATCKVGEEEESVTSLQIALQDCMVSGPEAESMDMIRVLLKQGADYLRNFNGAPLIFSANKHFELLKLFFECIGPEDSRLVVHVRDSHRETILHSAILMADIDIIKLILENGADAGARNISGQTAFAKLFGNTALQGTAQSIPVSALMAFSMRKQVDLEAARKILDLLEQLGGDACAMDDESYSGEEVERFHAESKSMPRIGEILSPEKSARDQAQIMSFIQGDSPCVKKLNSIRHGCMIPLLLAQSLAEWTDKRARGLISLDTLPDGWSEFFQEANQETGGLFTCRMASDQIPQILGVLKATVISACEWAVERNGVSLLVHFAQVMLEANASGAADELEEHVASLGAVMLKIYQENFRVSWMSKMVVLQQLKQIWKALNKGELLDLLYQTAVKMNVVDFLDSMDEYTIPEPLRRGSRTPASALESLSLPTKYPGSSIFVTTRSMLIPYVRMGLFVVQMVVFIFPCIILIFSLRLKVASLKCDSSMAVLCMFLWEDIVLSQWKLINTNYRLHPNIFRGLRAAWELTLSRLRHGFPLQEQVILAFQSTKPANVSITSRLNSMHKNALYPIYWLLLGFEDTSAPVPCYSAMGEVMDKWKDGRLPRLAWGDGWWELQGKGKGQWKRVNVTERPTWTQYSKASKQIKEHLLSKDCKAIYRKFLSTRDYYLEPAGQQLEAMEKLFGTDHSECTAIWRGLFIDESDPTLKPPGKRKRKLAWLERLVHESGIDRMRDLVVYTWDKGLLDVDGRPIKQE